MIKKTQKLAAIQNRKSPSLINSEDEDEEKTETFDTQKVESN
jgi:hypothetical protein